MSHAPVSEQLRDVNVMTVWPTIGATGLGRLVGALAGIRLGLGGFFTIGKAMAVATIPISLAVFCWQLLPFVCRRYTLTSRRIVVQKGYRAIDERAIALEQFDAIRVEVRPGQAWLHAGDLVFQQSGREVFRLSGVSRPDVFRGVCLETQMALLSVSDVLQRQSSLAGA
jgi:hypothetical protein